MMIAQLESLVNLQQIDLEIAGLKKNLDLIPSQIDSAKSGMEGIKKQRQDLEDSIAALQKKRNQLEQDVKAENDHIAKTMGKLPTVKTNKEYSAILTEVDNVKKNISQLEDQELEIMEELEVKEEEIPGLQKLAKEEEDKFGKYKTQKEAEMDRAKKELETAQAKREEIASKLEPKWAKHYQKVSKLRGDMAVVPLSGEICQGCHQQILPQAALEIRANEKIHECLHCNRILYQAPESETETAVPE